MSDYIHSAVELGEEYIPIEQKGMVCINLSLYKLKNVAHATDESKV